jgi:hypothetical protein
MYRNQKITRILQSFAFVPILATTFTFNPNNLSILKGQDDGASIEQLNSSISASSTLEVIVSNHVFNQEALLAIRARKIDLYFQRRGLPLAGYGEKMVEESIKNDLDWRIIPAIAMRESTGGLHACRGAKFNPFGWGSCKIDFKSYDDAIEIIAKNLGGNNHVTASYYNDVELMDMLENYNGGAVPEYPEQVLAIMKKISPEA